MGYGVGSFFKIGLIAMIFIILAKWLLSKVKVPALSAAAAAV